MIFSQVPMDVALKILGYPLPRLANMKDTYIW